MSALSVLVQKIAEEKLRIRAEPKAIVIVEGFGIKNAVVNLIRARQDGVAGFQTVELPLHQKRDVTLHEKIDFKTVVNVRRETARGAGNRIVFVVVLHFALGKIRH